MNRPSPPDPGAGIEPLPPGARPVAGRGRRRGGRDRRRADRGDAGSITGELLGLFNTLFYALFILMLPTMLRLLLRNHLAAIVAFAALVTSFTYFTASGDAKPVGAAQGILIGVTWAVVLFRFGLVAFVIGTFFHQLATGAPLTFDPSAWYWTGSLGTILAILAITAFGLHTALAGRRLLDDSSPG